jgi:YfiH family protein
MGPYESMNLGFSTDDERKNILKNYAILSEKLSFDTNDIVRTFQTHTSNIRYITETDKGKLFNEKQDYIDVDGLVTDIRNIGLLTFHADCTPIFFYDSVKKVIGMVHAGWKGTLDNIAGKMVQKLTDDFASNPEDIKTVIGPSLGQCCFEVDRDVADLFLQKDKNYNSFMKTKGLKYHFDLWGINKYNMVNAGMNEENIEISGLCTKCSNDLFFSHRGQKGVRGSMAGIIMMR